MRLSSGFRVWLLCLLACLVAIAVSFPYLDVGIARRFHHASSQVKFLESGLGGEILLLAELAVIAMFLLLRLITGRISHFGKIVMLGCGVSILVYEVNSDVLKMFFGVPNPGHVMAGARHAFNWFGGSQTSSFPSGHMALASAFAGVFMRHFRWSVWPLSGLLLVAAITLLLGDWHFLSDLFAGTFIGMSAGLFAGGRVRRPVVATHDGDGVTGQVPDPQLPR